MQRPTLMSQLVSQHFTEYVDIDLAITMTTPHKMKQLAKESGLRFQSYRHEFYLIKFVEDESDPEDEMMIEHTFYF